MEDEDFLYSLEYVLEQIQNGQRRSALNTLYKGGYSMSNLMDALDEDLQEIKTMVNIAINNGYLLETENFIG